MTNIVIDYDSLLSIRQKFVINGALEISGPALFDEESSCFVLSSDARDIVVGSETGVDIPVVSFVEYHTHPIQMILHSTTPIAHPTSEDIISVFNNFLFGSEVSITVSPEGFYILWLTENGRNLSQKMTSKKKRKDVEKIFLDTANRIACKPEKYVSQCSTRNFKKCVVGEDTVELRVSRAKQWVRRFRKELGEFFSIKFNPWL